MKSSEHGAVSGKPLRANPMTDRARRLRRDMTWTERRLWAALRHDQLGVRFRRQFVYKNRFILDFYAPEVRLAVEADGGQHAERPSDAIRDNWLRRGGVTMLRFWNNEISENFDGVVATIATEAERLREPSL